jgi:hypothetical protein
MKRIHGQSNNEIKAKWCSECKRWVSYRWWTQHTLNHKAENETLKAAVGATSTNTVANDWNAPVEPDYRQIRFNELEQKYKNLESKLYKMEKERRQLNEVIATIGRALVTTYGEY